MSMTDWAKREVDLAIKRENPEWDGESFDYGIACYKSALKAFESLCEDAHSGLGIGFTKTILDRLIENKPLTPITDEDFILGPDDIYADKAYLKDAGLEDSIQCPRDSSVFKDVHLDGSITYTDVSRVVCADIETGTRFLYGVARRIVDKMFPITLPYMPEDKPYVVSMRQFLLDKTDAHNGWDTEALFQVTLPSGEMRSIDIFHKLDPETNEWIEISDVEYYERYEEYKKNV